MLAILRFEGDPHQIDNISEWLMRCRISHAKTGTTALEVRFDRPTAIGLINSIAVMTERIAEAID